ncbi:MAG: hypothetical protein EOP46_14680 [Sphingobacteriaceae bacterium]|nr:MAG: hypothetical protein EOP46_14680 [Sphingobacteriaceae bacterium]
MKYILAPALICAALLSACSGSKSSGEDTTAADTLAVVDTLKADTAAGQICFLRTEGNANQDSTKVHLVIKDNKVTGQMQWLPAEKDSRKGELHGTQEGNTIKAVWIFMQEGMTDTLAVEFDFPGDKLSQKPFKYNDKTGREQTDDKAGYTIVYNKVDCK